MTRWVRRPRTDQGRKKSIERRAVWIFGSPRSGTTWLMGLLRADRNVVAINEPGIGGHLGPFVTGLTGVSPGPDPLPAARLNDLRAADANYFFNRDFEYAWLPGLRSMVLDWIDARTLDAATRSGISNPIPVLKEPNGSEGADLLLRATPAARVVFLLRDGRDVVDSNLDAASPSAWGSQKLKGYLPVEEPDRMRFVADRAQAWVARISVVQRALAQHDPALQMMVRYEDLLADAETRFAEIAEWLHLGIGKDEARRVARDLAFENIAAADRGGGKFTRAASPGLWKENLSPTEQELCESIMGDKLRELGYD